MRAFRLICLLLGLLAGPGLVLAQSVRVTSGEHEGFSRIVLQFPGPVDWTVTRIDAGYALSAPGNRPRYDLSDVFRLIPRDRLAAIFADPETGILKLNLGCACHAMPFELRPGLVVIDIRDGPAPAGSSFEQWAGGGVAPPILASTPRRPAPRPPAPQPVGLPLAGTLRESLDWRRDLLNAARLTPASDLPIVRNTDLGATREALIRQLGRGAAEGVVEFDNALKPFVSLRGYPGAGLDRHVQIGAEPGVDPDAGHRVPGMMTPEGGACLTDETLDLASWGRMGDVASSIGHVRSAMLGEFDQPDPVSVAVAVRYFLHLGFGAEARDLIRYFSPDAPDRDLWLGLAALLDGEPVTPDPFKGMQACDSAAALWAVLAAGRPPTDRNLDRSAVLRSFSALPVHLRRLVGPVLSKLFRDAGDHAAAGTVRDAVLRAPGDAGAGVRLMAADLQLATEGAGGAKPLLEPLIAGTGPTAIEATVRLITAQVAEGKAVDQSLITTAEAFLHEARGSERSAALAQALALGLASRARLEEALSLPDLPEKTRREVWDLFVMQAGEDRLFAATVGIRPEDIGTIARPTRLAVASRLAAAGLFRPALDWLSGPGETDFRLARAQANAGLRDWRRVMLDLAGLQEPEAVDLRARALAALNDPGALDLLTDPDAPEARRAAARRFGAWGDLLELPDSDPWAAAARLVTRSEPETRQSGERAEQSASDMTAGPGGPEGGAEAKPLETARQRIAESRAARNRIEALLMATGEGSGR